MISDCTDYYGVQFGDPRAPSTVARSTHGSARPGLDDGAKPERIGERARIRFGREMDQQDCPRQTRAATILAAGGRISTASVRPARRHLPFRLV